MRSTLVRLMVGGVLALVGVALAACGGSSNESTSDAAAKFAPVTAPPDNAKKGGTLNVIAAGDVDYIDPGAAYYQFTYMVTEATQRGLFGWAAGRQGRPHARPRERRADDLERQQDRHLQDQAQHQVQPAARRRHRRQPRR